jgi:hypothetical protein
MEKSKLALANAGGDRCHRDHFFIYRRILIARSIGAIAIQKINVKGMEVYGKKPLFVSKHTGDQLYRDECPLALNV